MPTEDVFILLLCLIDDWLVEHPLPPRPGPRPACTDAEILTIALARALLGALSERRFLRHLRADYGHLFPHLPAQSEVNRRTRWLWGAFEQLRCALLAQLPEASTDWLAVDTTPLPVKNRRRVQGQRVEQWRTADGLEAGHGYCAAQRRWFYGYRLAVVTPLAAPLPLVWTLAPAAAAERVEAAALLDGVQHALVLGDKGFLGGQWLVPLAARAVQVFTPQRAGQKAPPAWLHRFITTNRDRIEGLFARLKDDFALERHRALTPWGLLTRVMITLTAYTLRYLWRDQGRQVA